MPPVPPYGPPIHPPGFPAFPTRTNPIQEDDVRAFMGDLKAHELLGEQAWSSDDIKTAMRFAVMEYNELPPHGHPMTVELMPFSMTFLKAIAANLYRMRMQQLSHEMLTYQVGSVNYQDKETRYKAYTTLYNQLGQEWKADALNLKKRQNIEDGYDSILSPFALWGR